MLMKKLRIIICLIFILAITGCGKKESEEGITQEEKEKLVIWSYYETEAQQDGLDWLVAEFNHSQDE